MSAADPFVVKRLGPADLTCMRELNTMFGAVFEDVESFCKHPPSDEYLQSLLANESFIAIACIANGVVVGGLAAYELKKFERQRSEVYLYDLAVIESHRRKGVATALVNELKKAARLLGAWVIFVQADKPDAGAIAFYRSLTDHQEDVFHFDLAL
ncbi:MAG TPA: AAC(3)-I family aminoglycoside N-acetyltransferase [Steroidobacteraceae bacterium]|nr:AAC(3)-I family aminoglycoside N-acetyltransferase [Steroidobacteraceae bacterium]